jgi:hypothetical protein
VGITAIVPLGVFFQDLSKVLNFDDESHEVLKEFYELISTIVESYFSL